MIRGPRTLELPITLETSGGFKPGNKYRVVSEINFKWRIAFIQCVLTHAEYDTGQWKRKL